MLNTCSITTRRLDEIIWMSSDYMTVLDDFNSHNLTLTEAANLAQKWPLWRLLATSGAVHSEWCKPEK